MQAVAGFGVAVLVALSTLFSYTGDTEPSIPQVTASVGEKKQERKKPSFRPFQPEPAPAPVVQEQVTQVIIAAPVPRPKVEIPIPTPIVEVQSTPVPQPVPKETVVSVCLGKTVGALCTFEGKEGTCITPSWQPLTCVPHQ